MSPPSTRPPRARSSCTRRHGSATSPHDEGLMRALIVDGYNVIHAWPELRSALDRGGLEESRRLLTPALAEYAAVRGVGGTLVFGGPRTSTASPAEVVDGVTVRFGGASGSADHVIER